MQEILVGERGDALFGAPLYAETIELHLQRDRAARAAWSAGHAREISLLRERVRPVR